MSTYGYITHSELAHHGILGQKWGVRRFQNADGSLTPEGMRRYGHMEKQKTDSSVTKRVKDDWHKLDNDQFRKKYQVSKDEYSRRVQKYGDPYMNSPMAKYAKKKLAKEAAKKDVRNMSDFELRNKSVSRHAYMHNNKNGDEVINNFRKSDDYKYMKNAQYKDKKAQEIARKYIMDYAGAKLRDMGMKDSQDARKYLASKSYFQEAVPYVKDYVTYVPNLISQSPDQSKQRNARLAADSLRRSREKMVYNTLTFR